MGILHIINSFFNRRLVQPVLNLLKQGMTPTKLSATVALGAIIGIMPALGLTTILATALAARFRLNIAATVLVSYLVQPFQLLLAIPFIKLGILIFGLNELKLTFDEMQALFKADWVAALDQLWKANLAGVAAWSIISVPAGFVLYFVLVPFLKAVMPAPVPIAIPVEAKIALPDTQILD